MEYVLINKNDNVKVCLENGHKYATENIKKGEFVIKYGFPIGVACANIKIGEHVHSHNLKTALSGLKSYEYSPDIKPLAAQQAPQINAFVRKNGDIGIRNDIWIVPTVGCVNGIANSIARETGAFAFTHPYGCSQLGSDLEITQKVLAGLVKHPNAGGVLVLGLGCENNNIAEFKKKLGDYDSKRIRFLNCRDADDEIACGKKIISELSAVAAEDKRIAVSASKLRIGLKCGGSDGLSGIMANPLCGKIADKLTAMGGIAVLTEVPEMFGAEQLLMNRCVNETVFRKTVDLINNYKSYFIAHNQPISENPSPGNKAGGITTLEEKSLGCVQKGGTAPVTAVLDYGDTACTPGLNLLAGPGNDIVAATNLCAAGCHLILFTTGRGTPLGAPVPTLKISSNSALAAAKSNWVDYDAQSGKENQLFALILRTACGLQTKNEINGIREIAIFKSGVTL